MMLLQLKLRDLLEIKEEPWKLELDKKTRPFMGLCCNNCTPKSRVSIAVCWQISGCTIKILSVICDNVCHQQSKKFHANSVQPTSKYSDRFVFKSPSVLKIRYVGVLQFWVNRHLNDYVNCLIKITSSLYINLSVSLEYLHVFLIKYCTSWVYDIFENVFLYIICKGSAFQFIFMSSHLLAGFPPDHQLSLARVLVWVYLVWDEITQCWILFCCVVSLTSIIIWRTLLPLSSG